MIYESCKLANCKEAEETLIQKKKEVLDGKDPAAAARAAKTGFGTLATHYLEWAARQRSFGSKKFMIQRLVDTLGDIPLSGITTRLVEEYQTSRLNDGRKPATVNRELSTLKHMFTKANDWEMLGNEGLLRIRKVRKLQENNARLRYLSAEECQVLIAACDPHLRPVVVTAINTGDAAEEILSLEWEKTST
jgi:integrase